MEKTIKFFVDVEGSEEAIGKLNNVKKALINVDREQVRRERGLLSAEKALFGVDPKAVMKGFNKMGKDALAANAKNSKLFQKADMLGFGSGSAQKILDQATKKQRVNMAKIGEAMDNELSRKALKAKQSMLQLGLSTMFMGMMIQKAFTNIMTSSVSTFQKTLESSSYMVRALTPTYQAVNALGASFEYLKFVVGDALLTALLPIIPIIINLFGTIADFVSEHPEVTLTLIAGAIIGMGLATFGKLTAFLSSFISIETTTGLASNATNLTKIASGLTTMAGIGAIAYGITTFFSVDDKLSSGKLADGLLKSLSSMASIVGGVTILSGKTGPGVALLGIGVVLDLLSGDKLFKTLFGIMGIVSGIIYGAFAVIWELVKFSFQNMWNGLLFTIRDTLKMVINMVNSILPDWAQIGTGGIDKLFKAVTFKGEGTDLNNLINVFSNEFKNQYQTFVGIGTALDDLVKGLKTGMDQSPQAPGVWISGNGGGSNSNTNNNQIVTQNINLNVKNSTEAFNTINQLRLKATS